uniref:Reverse transcriptase n=1 Tax=Tanacetum cinerariifolium TaxID=118510 RepID=A0A6L2KID7_TANCI|nr:reverse transcriptase [Tanacetum cinerariifolium]
MLKRCEDTKLALNWEKSHFMVKEGIILGHKISKKGIEVDKAKIKVISKLSHPTTVKGIRSFLGHAGFYRRFIKNFSKISRPMTHLLEKNSPFIFSNECIQAFRTLKDKLTEAPILIASNWDQPFELMCDTSDYAVGAVLGQRVEKHFRPIHYASKTMNQAETTYTTTEKEMLAVVYAFEKFRSYLIMNKSIEFDFKVIDTKGAEIYAADHLSCLENTYENNFDPMEINETFPLESLKKLLTRTQGIYFMGPFSSSKGNKYILVAVDYFLKWVEDKALPTNNARVVVKILKSLFSRFGTPKVIISDRGTHFCNDQFARVMSKYGVTHRLSTAYHPQTSGQVEVTNRGLKRILERTVGENRALWSDKLEDALWAFRTAFKTPALKHANFDLKIAGDHRKLQLNELSELRDQAYENSLIYKEQTKKLHDAKIKNRIFNVGDQVLLFNSRRKIFSGCSSYGALYTTSFGYSKGGFAAKFVRNPNKTTDSSQQPPPDCPKCGNPIDGLYCRYCALLRKKLKEIWFTIYDEHNFLQDFINTSESSNDDSNVVNAPQEPRVFPTMRVTCLFVKNYPPLDVSKDQFEEFFDSNNDSTSINDDYFSINNINYVEASPLDFELVSLEEVEDDNLREKLLNINLLIAKIKSLNDNPTPDHVLKPPSPSPIPVEDNESFLEKFNTSLSYSDNSLPEFKTFSNHTEETNCGSTTTHADYSLLNKLDPSKLTSIVDSEICENVLSATNVNLPPEEDHSPLFAYVSDGDFVSKLSPRTNEYEDLVKLSDPKQALHGRHPILILM